MTRARIALVTAAILVGATVVGGAVWASGEPAAQGSVLPSPESTVPPMLQPSPTRTVVVTGKPMLPPAQPVLFLGDSLALSTYPWIADLLPDRTVTWEAEVGRDTHGSRLQLEARAAAGPLPPVLLVSSGTNDLSATDLEDEARRILDLAGPDRCVVWADVVRPEAFADGMGAANDALARAFDGRSNVIEVPWTAMTTAHPEWLSGDGIHPDNTGNEARAKALAEAVLSCSPLDPNAPVAQKEYLPPSAFLAPGGGAGPGGWSTPAASTASRSTPAPTRSATTSPSARATPPASSGPATPPESSAPPPPPTDPPNPPTSSPAPEVSGSAAGDG